MLLFRNHSRLTGRRADFVSILRTYDLTTMKEGAMHCPACHRAMLSTSSQAFEDEKGAMTITRWRCRPCHETAEEIRLSAGYRGPGPGACERQEGNPRLCGRQLTPYESIGLSI